MGCFLGGSCSHASCNLVGKIEFDWEFHFGGEIHFNGVVQFFGDGQFIAENGLFPARVFRWENQSFAVRPNALSWESDSGGVVVR